MFAPRPLLVLALTVAAAVLGCAQAPQTTPSSIDSALAASGQPTHAAKDQFVAAQFGLHVDAQRMHADVTPLRGGSLFQAKSFDLDLDAFLKPSSFKLTSITTDADGDLVIGFRHAHPFAAPNLAEPPTAKNRADLSYTGRLLFVREIPIGNLADSIFFDDGTTSIVADTSLMKNPDGYVNPGTLLSDPVLLANTFPYVLLADEAKDNRKGVSNGTQPKGNYAAAPGGWQRDSLSINPIGWTGYDFVHAGQTINNTFTLQSEALLAGPLDFQVAVLIKYTTPSGAPPRTNRQLHMPQSPTNVANFAYRLPFAALDASQSALVSPVNIAQETGATALVDMRLRDWDHLGIEAPDAELADETDVTLIQPGASGAPVATLSLPKLSASLVVLLPVSTSVTGAPGDELVFSGTITNTLGTAPVGNVSGLARFIDPEDDDTAAATYRFGSDPDTLVGDAARALQVRTYQHVPISIGVVPTVTEVTPPDGVTGTVITFTATATEGPTSWNWDFGAGATPSTSADASPVVQLATPWIYAGTVTATNAYGTSEPFPFSFSVSPAWGKHLIDADGGAGQGISMTPYGTGYAIIYGVLVAGILPAQPRVAVTLNPNPSGASDWTVATLDAGAGAGAVFTTCIVHQNRLYAAYYSGAGAGGQDLRVARANTPLPALPGSFTIQSVDTTGNVGQEPIIAEGQAGNLLIAHRNQTAPNTIRFMRSLAPDPVVAGDWMGYDAVVPTDHGGNTQFLGSRLVIHQGRPCFVFAPSGGTPTALGPWLALASVPDPLSKASWAIHSIDNTGTTSTYSSLAVSDGRLAVCYYDGAPANRFKIRVANEAIPVSSAGWAPPLIIDSIPGESVGLHCAMENVGGRLVAVYYHNPSSGNGNYKVVRALSLHPDLLDEWQVSTIEAGGAATDPGEFGKALLDHNGQVTVAYKDDLADDVWFGRATTLW